MEAADAAGFEEQVRDLPAADRGESPEVDAALMLWAAEYGVLRTSLRAYRR